MGHFNFNTIHTWDVAHHHGHSAFRLLRIVLDLENDFVASNEKLRTTPHGEMEYLRVLSWRAQVTTDMFRISAASIMMCQAMMEAIINDSLETEALLSKIDKGGSFRQKWTDALAAVNKDNKSFEHYFNSIYKTFRNPMVHPKKIEISSFDTLSFPVLLAGYESGWQAYADLYSGLGHPHDNNSWGVMCETHGIPLSTGNAS